MLLRLLESTERLTAVVKVRDARNRLRVHAPALYDHSDSVQSAPVSFVTIANYSSRLRSRSAISVTVAHGGYL